MSRGGDPFSILNKDPSRSFLPPKRQAAKVNRLWPGKIPEWAQQPEEEEMPDASEAGEKAVAPTTEIMESFSRPSGLQFKGISGEALIVDTSGGQRKSLQEARSERAALAQQFIPPVNESISAKLIVFAIFAQERVAVCG